MHGAGTLSVEEAEERIEGVVVEDALQLRHTARHVLALELEVVDEEVGHNAVEELWRQPGRGQSWRGGRRFAPL